MDRRNPSLLILAGILLASWAILVQAGPPVPARPAGGRLAGSPKEPELSKVPPAYQDKQMPAGGWTDPKAIAEGRRIYEGKVSGQVVCFACHGRNGKPALREARDFTDAPYIAKMTDGYWYWRIAEGVPNTPMKAWKDRLTEDQIWAVIAYVHTFSHGGKPADRDH